MKQFITEVALSLTEQRIRLVFLELLHYYLIMMNLILNNMPWTWLGLAIIFLIIEFLTSGLTTIWFAIGCVPMIFLSFLPISLTWQILIMLVISLVLLIFTRPYFVNKLKANKEKTNIDAVIGKIAIVTKEISQFEKGEIKTGGIFWTAKSEDDSTIPVNTECEIIRIDGVTAIVKQISQ